jgi:5-oxoprolinase (ATP-hydrolysing) subunit B
MPRVYLLSDRAIQIDWATGSTSGENQVSVARLTAFRQELIESMHSLAWPAFQCVQADQSITVLFTNSILSNSQGKSILVQLDRLVSELTKSTKNLVKSGSQHRILVNYGGVAGQDLQWLAAKTELSPEALIELHSSATYTVQFLGFLPGFAYLTGLPKQLQFARRETPRPRVPAGTLAIGAHYCAVYPWESPGGWHLLGHVEQVLFDPEITGQEGQSLFKAGDTVQFIRADHA